MTVVSFLAAARAGDRLVINEGTAHEKRGAVHKVYRHPDTNELVGWVVLLDGGGEKPYLALDADQVKSCRRLY